MYAADLLGRQSTPPSLRGILTVDMSVASSMEELRSMSAQCASLTKQRASWLGSLPSLVYCDREQVFNDDDDNDEDIIVTPSLRFEQMNIEVEPTLQTQVFIEFVRELLGGKNSVLVSKYFGSFVSIDSKFKVSYPLCLRDLQAT